VVVFSGGGSGTGPCEPARGAASVDDDRDDDGAAHGELLVDAIDHDAIDPRRHERGRHRRLSDVDTQGFVGHAARCDAGST